MNCLWTLTTASLLLLTFSLNFDVTVPLIKSFIYFIQGHVK